MRQIKIITLFFVIFSTSFLFAQPNLEFEGGNTYNWGKVKSKDSPLKAKIILKKIFVQGISNTKLFKSLVGIT